MIVGFILPVQHWKILLSKLIANIGEFFFLFKALRHARFKIQGSFISHYLYKVDIERKVRLQHMITR